MRKTKTDSLNSPPPITSVSSGSNKKRTRTQTNPTAISSERLTRRSTGFGKSDFDKSAQISIKSQSKTTTTTTPSSGSQLTRSTRKRPIPITPSKHLDFQSTSQSKRIKLSSSDHHLKKSEDLKENRVSNEDPTSDDELALKKPITRSNSKILTKTNPSSKNRNGTLPSKAHSNLIKVSPIQNKEKRPSSNQRAPSASPSSSTNFTSKLIQLFQKHHLDQSKLQSVIKTDPQSLISIIKSGLKRRSELNNSHTRINPEGELLDELNLLCQSINPNNTPDRSHRARRSANKDAIHSKPFDETSQSFLDEVIALIQLEFIEFDSNLRSNPKPPISKSGRQVEEPDDTFVFSDCLLSEVDARCLSVADESMSGGFEPDEEDEQEEEDDDDAVLAELAISKTSPIRNLPIDLPHDSPNSSPTRQSARIRKHTLLQHDRSRPIPSPTRPVPVVKDSTTSRPTSTISQSRPVSSFKPMSIPFVAVPSIRTATPQFTSPLPTTPTRTRTRALVATQTRPATTELPRTAAGTVTDALTSTTKSPSRNSKSKKKVYSKEIVLPLLHSLLPHLSGTKPLPIQFPNTDSVEMNDKRMVLNEIECLVGLDETELELRMVLNRTVVEHEGNVLLLCGGRGSGKTAVVNRTLSLFKDPRMHGQNSFITIRLNGLIQTNDKLALREMSRQLIIALNTDKIQALGTEEEQEELMIEDGTRFNTNAKTLKNLIHLLEPPLDQEEGESEVSKALVIVLEEFDRFTQLDRQAFLYTLLDIVQGNKRRGGICVIGTTAVVDCLDRLEKRVKSRCQSRIQYLFSPRTLIERKELIKSLLYLQNSENEDEENEEIKSFIQQWNDELDECLKLDGVKVWLENVFGLISDGIPKILQELNKLISTISYKLKTTKTIEFPILSNSIPFKTPKPSAPDLRLKPKTWWNDSNSLSTLELSILIGAKHLSQLYESRMFNLEMCWDSYRKHLKRTVLNEDEGGKGLETLGLLGKGKGGSSGRSQVYGRDAFEMGWERLINLEILLPIKNQFEIKFTLENHNSLIGKRFDYVRLILFLTEIDELIENRLDLALHLKRWCKNWSD